MIDKLFPRILSSDKDNRIRKKTEMNDALNVVATEDFNAVDEETEGGNSGVLKPVKGNVAQPIKTFDLEAIFPVGNPQINRRVLGRVSDPRSGVVYMFIYSEVPEEQGVYAYDAYGFFPGPAGSYRPIYRTSEFQFQSLGRVVGDVVHITGPNDTYRTILYFTDDVNEPRKLDVSRCVEEGFINPTGDPINYTMNSVDDKDLITACPKGPIHPIQFSWQSLAEERTSNFRRVPGMQFAFQCIYQTGEESAISTYSDIAVPDEYVRQGYYTSTLNLPDYLELIVPSNVNGVANFTEEVDRVRILVRRGNIGAWYIIDEVQWSGVGGEPVVYNFFNDRVLTGLTNEEQNRDFEALPQVAQALAVVENRLMYGNYVEGFDEVPLQASVNVNYYDRPQEFLNINITATPVVVPLAGSGENYPTLDGDPTEFSQRGAGVALDFSALPDTIPANSVITCNLRFDFGGSVELYNGQGTHHASQIIADNRLATIAQTRDGANEYYTPNQQPGETWSMSVPVPVAGYTNDGVGIGLRWRPHPEVTDIAVGGTTQPCIVGSSGTAPLRFQGPQGASEQLVFNVTLRNTDAITSDVQNVMRNAVLNALEYADPQNALFELLDIDNQATYSYNLNLLDPTDDADYVEALDNGAQADDLLYLGAVTLGTTESTPLVRAKCRSEVPSFAIIPEYNNRHLDYAKLISPVLSQNANSNTLGSDFDRSASGWIIVNAATLTFRLRAQDAMDSDPLGSGVLTLEVASVSNCDVRTCIPIVNTSSQLAGGDYTPGEEWLKFKGWRVFSGDYLYNNDIFSFGAAARKDYSAAFAGLTQGTWQPADLGQRARYAGWLVTDDNQINPSSIPGTNIYRTNSVLRQAELSLDSTGNFNGDEFDSGLDGVGYSLVDGQYTPAVYNGVYVTTEDPEGVQPDHSGHAFNAQDSAEIGCYGTMAVMFNYGIWGPSTVGVDGSTIYVTSVGGSRIVDGDGSDPLEISADGYTTFNTWERLGGQLLADLAGPGNVTNSFFNDNSNWQTQTDGLNGPQPEVSLDAYVQQLEEAANYRSFKTNATHALGIIYYDERGRPGNVNPIDPVYVNGYSPFERNGLGYQGRVDMSITLQSNPPQWAHFYQLVYGGSLTVQKFIQYSAAGAYIATSGDAEQLNNIYVSLNHLQFHPTVSYSEAFGAVHPDGTSDLYVYSPGDYLRVISYFTDETTQVFPENYVFEIAGQVTLGGDATTNVLYEAQDGAESVDVPDHLQGQFLILKDNITATGFNFATVATEGNTGAPSTANFWGNRCIFEIITPRREADLENLVYRETSQVYNVGRQGNNVYHQTPTLLFQNGDVWWRSVPVNIQEYNAGFVNLIQTVSDDDAEALEPFANNPRFRNVYLESTTFNDSFPGADVNGYGKAKIYRPDAAQVRRFASLIFGDDNNYSTRRVRFTVFNPSLAPFKDLPNEHGAINAILNYNDSLFVVQEDKASIVPVNRQIISDALGSNTLIATAKVLGEQQLIPGHAGADNNRESVIKVDDTVYFAHKGRHEVYRYIPKKGIQIISNAGLNAYFVSLFRDQGFGAATRVISGYDSLKDEYIITVLNANVLAEPNINEYTQPPLGLLADVGVGAGGVDFGDEGEGTIEWDTGYDGPAEDLTDEIINTGGTAPDGVSPGEEDGWPAPGGGGIGDTGNGTVDVAEENKERLDQSLQGVLPGFDPPNVPTSFENGSTFSGDSGDFEIDSRGILPGGLRETIGDFTISGGYGTFSSSGISTVSPAFVNGEPDASAVYDALAADNVNITGSNYKNYLGEGGVLFGSMSLPTAMKVRGFYLQERIVDIVAALKNGAESNIAGLINSLGPDVDSVISQLTVLGLNNQPNIATLIAETQSAYTELFNFGKDVMGILDPQVFVYPDGSVVNVLGFGNWGLDNYPLGPIEINVLQQFNTLLDNVGDTFVPLLSLDGVDLSSALENLARSNASLRNQVDVLSDQIQALSDAPAAFGGSNFIPGVTQTQLESDTVSTIAQDGQLTFSDVTRNFDPIVQFLLDNNAVVQTETINTALNEELAAEVILRYFRQLAILEGNQGFTPEATGQAPVDPTVPATDNVGYRLSRVLDSPGLTYSQRLRNLLGSLDPTSLDEFPGFGVGDIQTSLNSAQAAQDLGFEKGLLGGIDIENPEGVPGFLNYSNPAQPLVFVQEGQKVHREKFLDNSVFPLDILIEAALPIFGNLEAYANASTGVNTGYLRFYVAMAYLARNVEAGRYSINIPAGVFEYADENVPWVAFPWEDPRAEGGPQNLSTFGSIANFGNPLLYNAYVNFLGLPPHQAAIQALGGLTPFYLQAENYFLEYLQSNNINETDVTFELLQGLVDAAGAVESGMGSNVINPAVQIGGALAFGNTQYIQGGSNQDDVNQALANVINTINQNYS